MASDERHPRIRQRNAVQTDVGVIRDHNEDSAFVDPEGDFFIVADGMGGHAAGEVASKMAVEAVTSALQRARPEIAKFARAPSDQGRRALVNALENAVRHAHQSVYQRGAAETDKQGMGTTLDVVLIAASEAFVAHVGDSRTYLVRDRRAAQITTDHTVAEVLVIEGKLSIEEAQISPLRTILVNAIGVAPDVGVEMAHVRLKAGDRLLVCSDGLHDYFPLEQEVSDYISENDPAQALNKMVTVAKNRGGHDNITGIVLEVLEALDWPEGDEADLDGLSRAAYEDTGIIPAIADDPTLIEEDDLDAVPEAIARDDTAPVLDDDEGSVPLRPAADNRGGTGAKPDGKPVDKPAKGTGPSAGAGDPSNAAEPAGAADSDESDESAETADAPGAEDDSPEADDPAAPAAEPAGGKRTRPRGGKGKADPKTRGAVRKEIESADTAELPVEPGESADSAKRDGNARAPRSRS